MKDIYQFDTSGSFIKKHDTISLAASLTGATYIQIRDSLAKKIKVNKQFYFSKDRSFTPPAPVFQYRILERVERADDGFQKLEDKFLKGTY